MRWMRALGLTSKTANQAKGRLQIIIAQQRSEANSPDYLPALRKEILEIVAKYTHVKSEDVQVDLHSNSDNNSAVLELNVTLPSEVKETETETVKI